MRVKTMKKWIAKSKTLGGKIPCIFASISFSAICSSSKRLKYGRSTFSIYLESSNSWLLLVPVFILIACSEPDDHISNVEYKKSHEWLIYEGGTDLDKYR